MAHAGLTVVMQEPFHKIIAKKNPKLCRIKSSTSYDESIP